ncbi:MAG: hypothetical protein H6806_10040 [Planctomycetes bacterium]|nr:hypothetical protein [Planctomycetota bacterium]MCB9824671.1 hypothetical protein [Planctomycetota bacterium]MCB9830084.1 hypothetical protein [Planctomycetota bacterium]MCB9899917.1 hypothetical protein [Planctomycetota bacterium]
MPLPPPLPDFLVVLDRRPGCGHEPLGLGGEPAAVSLRRGPFQAWVQEGPHVVLDAGPDVVVVGTLQLHGARPGAEAVEWLRSEIEAHGAAVLQALTGRFALAVFDARTGALTLARDLLGTRSLVVHVGRDVAVAGSRPRVVARHPAVRPVVDEERVARVLLPELEWSDPDRTLWRDVRRLRAGSLLHVNAHGVHEERLPWPWRDAACDEEDVAEAIQRAVERAMPSTGTVAVLLSGGVDSGLVLAQAREVRRQRKHVRLLACCGATPPHVASRECDRLRATLRHLPPDGCHVVTDLSAAEAAHHVQRLVDESDDPYVAGRLGARSVGVAAAAAAGVDLLLTGIEGHLPFDAPPAYLAQTAERGELGRLLGRVSCLAHELRSPHHVVLRDDVLRPLAARWLRRTGRRGLERQARHALATADLPERWRSSRRLLRDHVRNHRHRAWDGRGAWRDEGHRLQRRILSTTMPVALERYAGLGQALGVLMDHPLVDPDVLAAAVALPAARRRGEGPSKAALRRIAAAWLPAEVVRGGMDEEPDLGPRARQGAHAWLAEALGDLRGELRPWIAPDVVEAVLARRETWPFDDRDRVLRWVALAAAVRRVRAGGAR